MRSISGAQRRRALVAIRTRVSAARSWLSNSVDQCYWLLGSPRPQPLPRGGGELNSRSGKSRQLGGSCPSPKTGEGREKEGFRDGEANTIRVCSAAALDQALATAADNAILTFACSGTITLTHPLFLRRSITLDGTGQQVTFSGDHRLTLIEISAHAVVTLRWLTFTAGVAQGSALINYGTVHLAHTVFTDNHHALLSYHRLTSFNDIFRGNDGDALFIAGKAIISGDAFINNNRGIDNASAVTTVSESAFIGNHARDADSIGAGIANSGTVYVTDSLFYDNEAATGGGAIGR